MVDLSKIYEAIRSLLSADADLMAALKSEGAGEKIFIGREMPITFISPAIQIVGLTDILNPPFDYSNTVMRINVYLMANINGSLPYAQFAYIIDRIYNLLNDYQFAIDGVRIYAFMAETRDADAVKDFSYDKIPARHLMGIEWRIISL